MKKALTFWSALALLAMAGACAKSNPTQPSTTTSAAPSGSGGVSGTESATIVAPQLVAPADGAQIKWGPGQPITLVVTNGVTTGRGSLTYSFQVASDNAFSNMVYSKDGVAPGSGQTSLTIDKLHGSTTYYWRTRVSLAGSSGPTSKTRSFAVGPEVVLQAPVLSTPGSNSIVGDNPTLTVNNVQRSGPVGTVVYRFDVAQAGDFSSIIYSGTVQEQPGTASTSLTVPAHLNDQTTYWWRVQATDTTNGIVSPMSNANPFVVQLFDMKKAIIYDNPPDVGFWPEAAQITYVDTSGPYIIVDFDRRDSPDRWIDAGFGDSGSIQYTLGACFNIDGTWYCSAPVQFWYGRDLAAGGPVSDMAENWYYNPIRWGRMTGHQPSPGELVGFWVGHGNLRGGNGNTYKERSNVQLVQFGSLWTSSSRQRKPLITNSLTNLLRRPGK